MAALALFAPKLTVLGPTSWRSPRVFKITTCHDLPPPLRRNRALIINDASLDVSQGYDLYLYRNSGLIHNFKKKNSILLDNRLDYLSEGDVIRFDPIKSAVKTLWRRNANSNSFLLTERCNSFCIMCSQPPRNIDDAFLLEEILDAIPLIDPNAREIGLTGGEPALYGNRLAHLLRTLKLSLPKTAVHVLSNGRLFSDLSLAKAIGDVQHPDLMLGIPLYSDLAHQHDFVVQAKGAFDETLRGVINLKRCSVRVEIRVVVHKQTHARLVNLAKYIQRNLLFVDHVALMGLEVTGFTRANLNAVLIDPADYVGQMSDAAQLLHEAGIRVSIYNHPLCALPKHAWRWAVKSISDWKNEYAESCQNCSVVAECGGLFVTSRSNPNFIPHPI